MKIIEDSELVVERFICDCKWQGHSLDITIEFADDSKKLNQCTLNLYMAGKTELKYRIKQAWECLKGKDGALADFIVRQEDIPKMIGILRRALPTYTSGTV